LYKMSEISVTTTTNKDQVKSEDNDDGMPCLSEHTLTALKEFYCEQEQSLKSAGVKFQEDWQLSQFWYDEDTASTLAQEALLTAGKDGRIACVSCPTAYIKLRQLDASDRCIVCLEYDERFAEFGQDFIRYDFNRPLDLPTEYEGVFDVVICDPPFLSEDCLRKTASTVKYLTSKSVILCTGAVMEELAEELLGTKLCVFQPQHKNKLSNEFRCFTNYTPNILNDIRTD